MRTVAVDIVVLLTFLCGVLGQNEPSFVVTSTEPPANKEGNYANSTTNNNNEINPKIHSMDILSNIKNRFATTLVTSRVRNALKKPEETTFSVVLPENAFVSEFSMEIDGKVYKAYVKEKEEAKKIYNAAISSGIGAAKVEASARDSNTFTVSVNIEPESDTTFRLTYEELLQRELGQYELVLNIYPGQIVDDLNVKVLIEESRNLIFVQTPILRTGNEISKNDDENLAPDANIEMSQNSAVVTFKPDKEQQKKFGLLLSPAEDGSKENEGIKGQFVVQYDVNRDDQGGEILVKDGYFVHFFAPTDLKPLPKHVVFVMDDSGSMSGRKIEQLVDAMQNILPQLSPEDVFDMIRFGHIATVWDVRNNSFQAVEFEEPKYGQLENVLKERNLPPEAQVTNDTISKAKQYLKDNPDAPGYSTNIIAGLEIALYLLKRARENRPSTTKIYQPMIIFLTDGAANEGVSAPDEIIDIVTRINSNSGESRAAIFSLSIGDDADKNFLQRLSLANLGFSRHIYEAADASLQLQDFYKKISSPLLSNVTFKYVDGISEVTRDFYPYIFKGSEIVVSGKHFPDDNNLTQTDSVSAINCYGSVIHLRPIIERPVTSLERLWAYLTVKQLLDQAKLNSGNSSEELKKKALDLSLKYSFVTEVSSLVVVRPNASESSVQPVRLEPNNQIEHHMRQQSYLANRFVMPMSAIPLEELDNDFVDLSSSVPIMLSTTVRPKPKTTRKQLRKRKHHKKPVDSNDSHIIRVKPLTLEEKIRKHVEVLTNGTNKLTTDQGVFNFGKSGDVTVHPDCPRTPGNGSNGECTILYDCPSYFTLVKDLSVVLQYFCPLENQFVGVCCPKKSSGGS